MRRSRARIAAMVWRTTAESSTTSTRRLDMRGPPRALHTDVAAPQVEDHVAVALAAQVLGGGAKAVAPDQGARGLDVAQRDVGADRRREHARAAEDLDL